jgi:hypothetical protein
MEYGQETNPGTKVLRITSDRAQSLRSSPEKNAVNDPLVLDGDGGKEVGHSEDYMEVLDRQQFRLPSLQPLGFGQ